MSLQVEIKKKLKGFTLDVEFHAAEQLGVLGASGCGKSMTLKCIAGVIRPDSGRIVLNGRVLFDASRGIDLKPQQRRVGYLFQNYALFPHMTVTANIACGRGMTLKEARRDSRISEVVGLLRLQGLEERYPLQLSGGQQQRVALARILAGQPELLLLDEPFSALDEHLREQLQLQMAEILSEWGENVILVTHNRDEVYKLTERLAVMDAGRIIGAGETKKLFAVPGHTEVARLTGCKNISRARRQAEFAVEALDWGLTLITAEPVPEDIAAIGIRAHSFRPAAPGAANIFDLRQPRRVVSPFENTVIFSAPSGEPLWWKYSDGMREAGFPAQLSVAPEQVLLLR
jgi:molybdate transport system ATP-binding protein